MPRIIRLTPKKVALALAVIVLFLLCANLVIIYLHFVKGHIFLRGFVRAFYFDTEANFPSLYSAVAISTAAFLLWRIGNAPREKTEKRSAQWRFLSLLFVFLAVDEFVSVHEGLIEPVTNLLDTFSLKSDLLYFAWLLPYGLAVLVLAIVYLRFFAKLPGKTRTLFFVAGAVFLSGAIVLEMLGGRYWALQGWSIDGSDSVDVNYALITTSEELLEMVGIIVFIYALLDYYLAVTADHNVTITLSSRGDA